MVRENLKLGYIVPALISVALLHGTVVRSADVDLRLDVEGSIQPRPTWRDANNQIITNLTFKFEDVSNPNNARASVDSQPSLAKLVDAGKLLWISVELSRPKKCRIGDGRISDEHVYLIHNLRIHDNDGLINIWQYRNNEFKIRFAAEGSYGSLAGAVFCETPGMLRYTYD